MRKLTLADLTVLDGQAEPLVKDLKLPESLRMKSNRLLNIRALITRNIEEI
jgi:hypothetical protein